MRTTHLPWRVRVVSGEIKREEREARLSVTLECESPAHPALFGMVRRDPDVVLIKRGSLAIFLAGAASIQLHAFIRGARARVSKASIGALASTMPCPSLASGVAALWTGRCAMKPAALGTLPEALMRFQSQPRES